MTGNPVDGEPDASGPKAPLSAPRQLTLSVLWFALNFQSAALLPIVLPVQIALFIAPESIGNAAQATFLAWLSAIGALIALFVPPLVGALSDRTTARLGRRRPYIAVGGLLLVAAGLVLAVPATLVALVGGMLLFQLGGNIATAAYQGLLPDLVPETQRGAASGYVGLMTIVGNAGSLALASILLGEVTAGPGAADLIERGSAGFYLLTTGVLVVGTIFTLISVHEVPLPLAPAPRSHTPAPTRRRMAAAWRHNWLDPWRHPDFTWVFLTRSSVMLGLSLFLTFIEYYFANVAHVTNFVAATALLAILALLAAATSALALGLLSDRIGRVAIVCFSTACMALAALAFFLLPAGAPLWPLGLLFGVGYGAYSSVDWALAVDALPSLGAAGKDMGLWSIATTLPAVAAPLLGGLAITLAADTGNAAIGYRAVFALAVALFAVGAVFILKVRDRVAGSARISRGPHQGHTLSPGWRLAFRSGGGRARGFLRFWPIWDRVMHTVHPVHAIPGAPYDLLRVEFTRLRARPITLPDGTRIVHGDRVAEVHINNRVMASVLRDHGSPLRALPMLAADLRALAAWASASPDVASAPDGHAPPVFPPEVRALYAFTLLGRGAPRLGFTLRERPPTIHTRLDRFFMTGLLVMYNSAGLERLARGGTNALEPVEIWMSRAELLRRYGASATDTARIRKGERREQQ